MRSALIVGSGPAAAGVALALEHVPDLAITVIDVGESLEASRRAARSKLGAQDPSEWDGATLAEIIGQPVDSGDRLPQKRAFGSDFPFRDRGQRTGITTNGQANSDVVSGAYGGFSNVWGAQVMPFARAVTEQWPITTLDPHYRAVLAEMPYAAEPDDLAEHFPLLGDSTPLPPMAARSEDVLRRYERHRGRIRRLGVTVGKARLAMDAPSCVNVGLCLTGCPYELVYSASHTFDRLRRADRIRYLPGLLAIRLLEQDGASSVVARELASGATHAFTADRIFVACGGVGSTQLAAASLGMYDRDITMAESQQFVLPMASLRPTPDPRGVGTFTLNQFNATVAHDDRAYDLAQVHYYTYNPAFEAALPGPLRWRVAGGPRLALLRRLSVGIGYLPSWHSPRLRLRASPPREPDSLPAVRIAWDPQPATGRRMLARTLRQMLRAAPLLDLYPVVPLLSVSKPGKSYHFGASFPHAPSAGSEFSSDAIGRVGMWGRIHLVDASVFPSVPATTFTLTVMANAHRIAAEAVCLA